ncbi:trypsin-1-like [Mycetomoellerius zeteki]|uniref:trypsin-1-like n=1 Tax=Mycetomoellerius zeteki TaxID=64791 RepID=UPI00084E9898|nr:PREDICTED: trypsin-1-like [Trachymyrmex zeteki]
MGLSSNSTMYSRAIVFFAVLTMAVAANVQPRINIQMPPTGPGLTSFETRVVGGDEAPKGRYPYMLSLQRLSLFSYQHFCGGSILNEQWGITAAHCTVNNRASSVIVMAGKFNLKLLEPTEQLTKVSKWIIHEKYKGGVGPNDIALIKFTFSLKLNMNTQPIVLPQPNSEPTGQAWLSGWSSTSTTDIPILPSTLQHALTTIIDRKLCDAIVTNMTGFPSLVDDTNICTEPKSSKPNSACSGDSGGPLAIFTGGKPVLIGLVSWGLMPCGTLGAPTIYISVSKFNDWIAQNINPHFNYV